MGFAHTEFGLFPFTNRDRIKNCEASVPTQPKGAGMNDIHKALVDRVIVNVTIDEDRQGMTMALHDGHVRLVVDAD